MRVCRWLIIILALMLVASPATLAANKGDIDLEKKLGEQGAAEAAKTLKFVTDESYTKRVETMGGQLAEIAKKVKLKADYGNSDLADFNYSFKIVDDKQVNAFSIPAGYIYINKGLIDRIESDDELAGVIAHEIAHVAHHHMLKLLKTQSAIDRNIFLIIAAAAIGKVQSSDMQNIFYGAKLIQLAKLNSYSMDAERDADRTAIEYMLKTKYNPVGMLTFMEKLARDQAYNPVDPGVLQDHPLSRDRAKSIISQLQAHNIPINRRAVASGAAATVRTANVGNRAISEVVIGGRVVFQPADTPGATSAKRAKTAADALNRQFELGPQIRDVRVDLDHTGVYLRDELVVDIRPADASLAGVSREDLANKAKESIQAALLSEGMQLMY